jgi:hypothetical protein
MIPSLAQVVDGYRWIGRRHPWAWPLPSETHIRVALGIAAKQDSPERRVAAMFYNFVLAGAWRELSTFLAQQQAMTYGFSIAATSEDLDRIFLAMLDHPPPLDVVDAWIGERLVAYGTSRSARIGARRRTPGGGVRRRRRIWPRELPPELVDNPLLHFLISITPQDENLLWDMAKLDRAHPRRLRPRVTG